MTIDDVTVRESDGQAVFTLRLDPPVANEVSVEFTTMPGSASEAADFVARSGSVTFNPQQTEATITVPITGDAVVEPREFFRVLLTSASGATIADDVAVGTILDDDAVVEDSHWIYATADKLHVNADTSVPPNFPNFGGTDAADYIVTQGAFFGVDGLLDDWDFITPVWHAILSTVTEGAKDRVPVSGPIYNTHGLRVADGKADLWDGSLHTAIGFDEFGNAIPTGDDFVWTGTLGNGLSAFEDCEEWVDSTSSGATGRSTRANGTWMNSASTNCTESHRLYGLSPAETPDNPGENQGFPLPPTSVADAIDPTYRHDDLTDPAWLELPSGITWNLTATTGVIKNLTLPSGVAGTFDVTVGDTTTNHDPAEQLDLSGLPGGGATKLTIARVDANENIALPLRLAISGGSLIAQATDSAPETVPADLTGNGFVDFQDLTILLANWNQNVSAAEGNLVEADTTPVNFEDLTVLLAAWTGPGPAASPQPAATEATVQPDTPTTQSPTATTVRFDQLTRRAHTPSRRIDPSSKLSSHDSPLRRLQAVAVDRAMGEDSESTLVRRKSAFNRRRR